MNASKNAEIKRQLDFIDCNNIDEAKIKEVVADIEETLGIPMAGGGAISRSGTYDYHAVPDDEDDIANRISDRLTELENSSPHTLAKCKQLIREIRDLLDY